MLGVWLLLLLLPAAARALELSVDCSGAAPPGGLALPSLAAAQAAVRAHFAAADAAALPRAAVTVHVRGTCASRGLAFTAADSGPVTWRAAPGARAFVVSGGAPLTNADFAPVSDAGVLAQLPAAARARVRQADLRALGLDPGPAPISGRQCRQYAEGLPQPHSGGMPPAQVNSPTGLELFAAAPAAPGGALALRLAHYPPQPAPPSAWSHVLHSTTQGPFNRTLGPDLATLARSAAWAQQFAQDPGSIFVHEYSRLGWADMHWRLEGLTPHNLTFGGCGNMSIGEHYVQTGNYFYSYNILAELDSEGEYYVNRTSRMLYAWLPAGSGSGSAPGDVAAYASLQEAPLLDLQSVAGHTWQDVAFLFGRGIGVNAVNASGVALQGVEVAFVGLMAVNVSGGADVALANLSVHDTGNGGVYLYAGDRALLQAARHVLADAAITRYNRYTHCYTPGVVLGGVGNSVLRSRIWDAPHQAVFLSGNEHTLADCDISTVTQITADSGAFYMGRDLSYRGNKLLRNSWHDINSVNIGTPILYLDDCASSVEVVNNTFRNCSGPTAASEGGKAHKFIGNYIGEDAQGLHVVGKSCAGALPYLDLVPWNTSAAWLAAYPEMVAEVAENSGAPWHLVFEGNARCAPRANSSAAAPFADISAKSVLQYNGSDDGGVNECRAGGSGGTPPPPFWAAQPVRGWNSWTAFGCSVTEADLRETADLLVSTGLAAAGYTIVAPDDCWAGSRAANGSIVPDPAAFPSGMAATAAYIRSRGLSFGIYTAIGNTTCAHRPGSAGYEANDAATYASWGVTWAKIDNCNYPHWDPADLYGAWARALDTQPYRIPMATKAVLNYSAALAVGAASRRVGGDVSASWTDLLGLAYMAEPLWAQARAGSFATGTPSFYTDVELLQVGNGGLTADQQAAHFWLWCALHAPLMLSTRLAGLSKAQVALLANPEALAVNHDAAGAQARRLAYQALPLPQRAPPLAPLALGCSRSDSPAPALNQAWVQLPAPAPAPPGAFRLALARNTSLCLLRPHCSSDAGVAVDACASAGAGACEGGLGAAWLWGSTSQASAGIGSGSGSGSGSGGQQLLSAVAAGGCLTMEPRVSVTRCAAPSPSPPYQALTYNAATGQLVMNFTGSGAQGDYTGYEQCLDSLQTEAAEVWGAALSDGSWAVLLLNPSAAPASVRVNVSAIAGALQQEGAGGGGSVRALKSVRDVGFRASLSNASTVFEVPVNATGARFLRVTPA